MFVSSMRAVCELQMCKREICVFMQHLGLLWSGVCMLWTRMLMFSAHCEHGYYEMQCLCVCVLDVCVINLSEQTSAPYNCGSLLSLHYPLTFKTNPGLSKALLYLPRWEKYIKTYTIGYIKNADGNPYFLLTFHFLWHKAKSVKS